MVERFCFLSPPKCVCVCLCEMCPGGREEGRLLHLCSSPEFLLPLSEFTASLNLPGISLSLPVFSAARSASLLSHPYFPVHPSAPKSLFPLAS